MAACSLADTNRDSRRTSSGNAANRWLNVRVVLRGEDRRRDEDRDLLAVLDRLERGPQRDLGLAVADVADDEPVHRPDALHVGLDLGYGPQLVGGLLVRERGLHLRLPRRVGGESVALRLAPRCVQLEQLLREVRDGLAGRAASVRSHSAPPSLLSCGLLAAGVARDPPDLLDRHEDPVAARERTARGSRVPRRSPADAAASARSGRRRGRCGRRGRRGSAARGCRAARPAASPSAGGPGRSRTARGR